MDAAGPTYPMWWIARQWVRFLTGLAILVVASACVYTVSVHTASAQTVSARTVSVHVLSAPAASSQPAAGSSASNAVHAALAAPASAPSASASASASAAPASASAEIDSASLGPALPALGPLTTTLDRESGQRRPARLAGHRTVDVVTAGTRAPPAQDRPLL